MNTKKALDILKVNRNTLSSYVKKGIIKVTVKKNKRYDYLDHSVYQFLNGGDYQNVIYARGENYGIVNNQIDRVKEYCIRGILPFHQVMYDLNQGNNTLDKMFEIILNAEQRRINAMFITSRSILSDSVGRSFYTFLNQRDVSIMEIDLYDEGIETLDSMNPEEKKVFIKSLK